MNMTADNGYGDRHDDSKYASDDAGDESER